MAVTAPARPAPPAASASASVAPAASAGPRLGVGPLPPPRRTVLGMLLVVGSEAMVLGTLLATYFAIKGGSPRWPAKGVKLGTYLPTVITITAGMSAVAVAWMVHAVRRNDQRNGFAAAVLTLLFGLAMANAQWYSMTKAGFAASKHAYGTLYYLLIGFHLAHLVAGIVMVVIVAAQILAGHVGRDDDGTVRAAAIFWQFGNAAWFSIMFTLFALSRHAHK